MFFRILLLIVLIPFFTYGLEKATKIDIVEGIFPTFHPVSTKNPLAQRFFEQGLSFYYAYNYDGAYRSFHEAAVHDPELAMAYWGMALALGQLPMNMERKTEIQEALAQAKKMVPLATANEQGYIFALSQKMYLSS